LKSSWIYGERLDDPQTVLELIVALSIPTTVDSPTALLAATTAKH